MGRKQGPRKGSLQFWPRQRADKSLPRVNWVALKAEKQGLLGFICYKAGMRSAYVKDITPDSKTKNKRIIIPVTIVEAPSIKIFSVRFYKNNKVKLDVINDNVDKEMKKKVKLPKASKHKEDIEKIEKSGDYDDISVIVYSQVKKTDVKKTPDLAEIGLGGTKEEKLSFVKNNLAKEISIKDVFPETGKLVDVRGITIGKGIQGPVKRFGVHLRSHKAEKGVRKVGSIGPWHPSRISFRVPFAGQMGFFNRIVYNNQIIDIGSSKEKEITPKEGFHKYGAIKTDYLILKGSIQGRTKRQLLVTSPLRPTKKQKKKRYELIELR